VTDERTGPSCRAITSPIENVALSSRIGYVEYRRDAQGGFTLARMKKLLGEDATEERM
jgi:hypothetical protein